MNPGFQCWGKPASLVAVSVVHVAKLMNCLELGADLSARAKGWGRRLR